MGAIILGPVITPDWEPPVVPVSRGLGALLDATHVSLAREIAQGIHEMRDILPRYGFHDEADPRWLSIKDHPEFVRFLDEAIREWHSADSTDKRVKVKAQASVEAFIPELHAAIHDHSNPLNHRVEAAKLMSRLGDMGEGAKLKAGQGGPGFSVTINIGNQQRVRLSAAPERPVIDSDAIEESADQLVSAALTKAGV